jgi:hypothetical protein
MRLDRTSYKKIWITICFAAGGNIAGIWAQCSLSVTHLTGTQTVGCVDVTVAASGSTFSGNQCGIGPYWAGRFSTGSYTFTFSQPIQGVTIGVTALNNNIPENAREEVAVYINGAFYVVTQPGVGIDCFGAPPAEISPTGTIVACENCISTSEGINIQESITSIEIESRFLSGGPGGTIFSLDICCCESDAGEIDAAPLNLCLGTSVALPDAVQTFLDANDLLQYVLFSDPNNLPGSILLTSNTPDFTFNPVLMQVATSYYVAAIAGNNLNGSVDPADPCFDSSNAIEVRWNEPPAVSFSINNPNVCAGDCTNITANFTGLAPFTLTYSATGSGESTQTFATNTGQFQVCLPVDTPPGAFQIQATALTDTNCTCN